MKLFIIVVVSVIVCCNAHDELVQLLEAILNETRVTRELQYQNLQKNAAQENALNILIDKVDTTNIRINKLKTRLNSVISNTQATSDKLNSIANKIEYSNILQQNSSEIIANISSAQYNSLLDLVSEATASNAQLDRHYNELHSTRQEAQDYHEVAQQWYTQPNVFVSFASCEDIKTMSPSAPSGYYNITKYDGTIQRVYCDIEDSHLSYNGTEHSHQCGTASIEYCGSTGWTRVAYLNMSDPSQQCPAELRLYSEGGVRACGRQITSSGSCDSVTFSTNGISYSQVCGRVIGYQYASTDALYKQYHENVLIDNPYIEGISITHGSPRQHIWTFMGGLTESVAGTVNCPCNTGSSVSVPSFVGDDYFCESGSLSGWTYQLYPDDPLWDGEGCGGLEGPCCNVTDIPWFYKILDSSISDDIELRVCADQETRNEDVPVGLYEIYIK